MLLVSIAHVHVCSMMSFVSDVFLNACFCRKGWLIFLCTAQIFCLHVQTHIMYILSLSHTHTHTHTQLLKKINKVHSVFVTCLTFVSASQPGPEKKQVKRQKPVGKEVLLSVSVDRTCSVTDTTARSGKFSDYKKIQYILFHTVFHDCQYILTDAKSYMHIAYC